MSHRPDRLPTENVHYGVHNENEAFARWKYAAARVDLPPAIDGNPLVEMVEDGSLSLELAADA